jgi:hypothetical protein
MTEATYQGLAGVRALMRSGLHALWRYTGTLFAVFLAQSVLAIACMLGIAMVLTQTFARLPMFDDAVDGDIVAMIWVVRHEPSTFIAIGSLIFAALVVWQVASWFLTGGLYGVLAKRPEGRAETMRCFGASGATTYFAYARLAIVSVLGYMIVFSVFAMTLSAAWQRLELALTIGDLLSSLALVVIPTGALALFFGTVTDHARVELTLRHESHRPGAFGTYLRTVGYVLRNPLTLVHVGLGWLLVLLVSLAYAYIAYDHPMYGAGGAITLFFVRQGMSLARVAIRVAVMAGQVELGRTRRLPPVRRSEPAPQATERAG